MAGNRSLLAFWVGGAASPPASAGVKSMLAPWVGGASSPAAAVDQAAVRSLLAFWIGGAADGAYVAPPPPQDFPGGGYRFPVPADLRRLQRLRLIEDEELLIALLVAVVPGLMRRH